MTGKPEVWLRGPIPEVPALLQPVAHSLLQSREEVEATLPILTTRELAARPGGAASAGYHVRHAAGSLDRLFTYARGESLTVAQRQALADEQSEPLDADAAARLARDFGSAVDRAIAQLRATGEAVLLEPRAVGRARLPSTVLGLLFHGAEHTQRHVGQLVAIAKVVRADSGDLR